MRISSMTQPLLLKSSPTLSPSVKFGDLYPTEEELDTFVGTFHQKFKTEATEFLESLKTAKENFESNIQLALDTEENTTYWATTEGARVLGKAYAEELTLERILVAKLESLKTSFALSQSADIACERLSAKSALDTTIFARYIVAFTNMTDALERDITREVDKYFTDAGAGAGMLRIMRAHQEKFDEMIEGFERIV